uniref:RING-type domain-containing protein n=1 Tax=Strigamia maritima TaxID=126957 RepID=T1J8S7_STRMM
MAEQGDFDLQRFYVDISLDDRILETYRSRFMRMNVRYISFIESSNPQSLTDFNLVPLHSRVLTDDDVEQNCVICLGEQKCKQIVKDLPCKHVFHSECIDYWLVEHYSCPLCRTDLRQNANN